MAPWRSALGVQLEELVRDCHPEGAVTLGDTVVRGRVDLRTAHTSHGDERLPVVAVAGIDPQHPRRVHVCDPEVAGAGGEATRGESHADQRLHELLAAKVELADRLVVVVERPVPAGALNDRPEA